MIRERSDKNVPATERPASESITDTHGRWRARVGLIAVGAVALRLILLLGRGDYLAFDEGFYLLLGRSLLTGDGYSLVGIPHTALSPLFPLLAGAAGVVLDSWVWGGRIVAAVAAGLLVLPAWAVFRRLAEPRVAFTATLLVAVLPSLAPFVVPFWIGADLWVGAEPLLHLLLYTGVAAWLWANEGGGLGRWAVCGGAFGLAFLARPEAIITWGLLGLAALGAAATGRSLRRVSGATVMGVAFVLVAAPYWFYLHDATGQWMLNGRGVAPVASAASALGGEGRGGPAGTIEQMLWEDDKEYERRLYGLDPTGLRLANGYWGVYQTPAPTDPPASGGRGEGAAGAPGDRAQGAAAATASASREPPSPLALFLASMRQIFPLLLWPFVILGAVQRRPRPVLRMELPVTFALVGTSLAIATLVAIDPRTQLFLVPLLALYAARGFALVEQVVQGRVKGAGLQPGFVELVLAAVTVVWLLGINARRLQLSVSVGSPHHIMFEQNRAVAESLDALGPSADGPVMSWHPALAVYADRDWRVLPHATLPEILRYGQAAGAGVTVLSAYYPPDLKIERLDTRYLVLPLPAGPPTEAWDLRLEEGDSILRVGTLKPIDPAADGSGSEE